MRKKIVLAGMLVAILVGGLCADTASAGLLVSTAEPAGERTDVDDVVIGTGIGTGTSSVTVNALGVWEDANGLGEAHDVGLWTVDDASYSNPVLIASATVPAGGGIYDDGWRYALITPVALTANTRYVVAAYYADASVDAFNDPYVSDTGAGAVVAPGAGLHFLGSPNRFETNAGGLVFPTSGTTGPDGRWTGGNATFIEQTTGQPIPEPGVAGLLLCGAIGLLRRRRHM
jgi:hypothetical protein